MLAATITDEDLMNTSDVPGESPQARTPQPDHATDGPHRAYPRPDGADEDNTGTWAVLAATRALLVVTSRAEASNVVRTAVEDLGGVVVPAEAADPLAIPVDVSLGVGPPAVVSVVDVGVARVLLLQHLPLLVEIALAAAARCEATAPADDAAGGDPDAADGDVVTEYVAAVATVDVQAATAVMTGARERGRPRDSLIRDLGAAQRSVGEKWFSGEWGIAQEHAATAVSEQVLTLFTPPVRPVAAAKRLLLACAEGEWHTMAARLAGELARSTALEIVMLGGSIPAPDLRRHIRIARPAAVLLSCTMAANLLGAARSIEAATAEGVPVIVGGAGWGHGQHRARRLGAVVHLDDPARVEWALDVAAGAPLERVHPIPREALVLEAVPTEWLQIAHERHTAASSWMSTMSDYQRAKSLAGLGWLAKHAAVAVACDDASVLGDAFRWSLDLLVPRGVPADVVIDSGNYLADAVEPEAPLAAGVLRQEARRASRGGQS